jgi:hypothetical protein
MSIFSASVIDIRFGSEAARWSQTGCVCEAVALDAFWITPRAMLMTGSGPRFFRSESHAPTLKGGAKDQ